MSSDPKGPHRMRKTDRRAMYRAAATFVRQRYPHRVTVPSEPAIVSSMTRDECLFEARTLLEELRWKRRDPVRQLRGFEARALLFAAQAHRREGARRASADTDRAFYVTIRDGARHGFLYGPFPKQMDALREVQATKSLALELNNVDAAFASFGTASLPWNLARPGVLNDRLPPLPAVAGTAAS